MSERVKSMGKPKFPTVRERVWAILDGLKDRRRPVAKSEIPLLVAKKLSLLPEVIDWIHKDGPETELQYRIGWDLTNLKKIGAVDNMERGYWGLTRVGEEYRYRKDLYGRIVAQFGPEIIFSESSSRVNGKGDLLDRIRKMDRDVFENICQRFLLNSGFLLIDVTKRTSIGFEGTGTLRTHFISFRVFFRFQNSAQPIDHSEIRTFREAVSGRADKGIFITTNSFSQSALMEAKRDIMPAIEFINGTDFCTQLARLGINI